MGGGQGRRECGGVAASSSVREGVEVVYKPGLGHSSWALRETKKKRRAKEKEKERKREGERKRRKARKWGKKTGSSRREKAT